MTNDSDLEPIVGDGFELVLVPYELLRQVAAGQGAADEWSALGVEPPTDLLVTTLPAARRVRQVEADPSVAPWLTRFLVVRNGDAWGRIAGHVGGHDRPDDRGMVEIGYTLDPAHRGHGLVTRAAAAWFDWAAQRGGRVARIQTVPDNTPSLAVARRLGLVEVGEAWDEDDQVWERVLEAELPLHDRPG
ncbi:MAG: N-acetyltransferase [Acidimicrobiales bacterium]|nr:N-acetyltransferase [Acidimicrobiales bacterium]